MSKKQYEKMAQNILKRRKKAQPIVLGEPSPVKIDTEPEVPAVDETPEVPGLKSYEDMEKKELKALCDERGIEYPSKVTNDKLIELLTEGE